MWHWSPFSCPERSLGGLRAGEEGDRLDPREAVLVSSCLRSRRVVGDASGGRSSGLGSNLLQTRGAPGLGPRSGSL